MREALGDRSLVSLVSVSGRKARLGAGRSSGGAEAAYEREPLRDQVGVERRVVHQAPDRVVGGEMPPGFPVDAVMGLGAHHDLRSALMGFKLGEG